MAINRREFLNLVAVSAAAAAAPPRMAHAAASARFKALAFDAFPIFDPRPVFALAETLFPGKGAELSSAWRTRQFEYQWLRALSGRYADFRVATDDALVFAAEQLQLDLTAEKRARLVQAYSELKAWPDVAAALDELKQAGFTLALLSNVTQAMLEANLASAGLAGRFDAVLSTDRRRTYKPDPKAYQIGVDELKLRREEILFVAYAGWDAAGAKSFGYPTFWLNRMKQPAERLGVTADATGAGFDDLVAFCRRAA